MNKKQIGIIVVALALMGFSIVGLGYLRTHQSLGKPGVKTKAIAGTSNLHVVLPAQILDYTSKELEMDDVTTNMLPKDTSFGRMSYTAPDSFGMMLTVVLMGSDRTSIHRPQFCLTGGGWAIDKIASRMESIHIERPFVYDLPVLKLVTSRTITSEGQKGVLRGLYVYWFVADDKQVAGDLGWARMLSQAWHLVSTGTLERWAYISCFAVCAPGQEDATFERMRKFLSASVPEFQTPPKRMDVPVTPRG
jgi:hypothetical protein